MSPQAHRSTMIAIVVAVGFVVVSVIFHHDLDNDLINAIKREDDVAVRSLLARGANANTCDASSRWYRWSAIIHNDRVRVPYPSALIVLLYKNFEQDQKIVNIARALLEHGAGTEEHYLDGNTPLMQCVWQGKTQLIDLLLERGANVNARNNWGATALMFAGAHGGPSLTKLLAKHRADINARDDYGTTALMCAVDSGSARSVAALLSLKADPNIRDNANMSPLAAARAFAHAYGSNGPQMVTLLKKAGGLP